MRLTLVLKKQEAPDVTSFILKPEKDFAWQAGQFLHYALNHPNPDSRKTERYFTISSAPFEGHAMITTRFAGQDKSSTFKKALFSMNPGDAIEAEGPEGEFLVDDASLSHVFIAGGIGITPYRAILLDLDNRNLPMNILLLYGNRDQNIVFKKELEDTAARHPDLKIKYFIDPQKIDEAAIRSAVPDLTAPLFYVSGPEPMVEALEKMLLGMGIADAKIKRDYFPGYNWP